MLGMVQASEILNRAEEVKGIRKWAIQIRGSNGIPRRGKNKCKGPEAWLRNRKEINVTGMEGVKPD